MDISGRNGADPVDTLVEIYQSWMSRKIENFNSSVYYENPAYLSASYLEGCMLA
jgi:hypothetical protein